MMTILTLAGVAATAAASPSDASTALAGPVAVVARPCEILFLAPGQGARADITQTFTLEGAAFDVQIETWSYVSTPALAGVASRDVDTQRRTVSAAFTRATGSGGAFGVDAVFAVYPTPGARPDMSCAYEGSEGATVAAAHNAELKPRAGAWTRAPAQAFGYAVPGDHLALRAAPGVHEVRGNFTLYVWDVDFSLADAAQATSFHTGISQTGVRGRAGEERWSWARIDVTEGALSLAGNAPFDLRARDLAARTSGTHDLEFAQARSSGARALAPGDYAISTNAGSLAIASQPHAASVLPGVTGAGAQMSSGALAGLIVGSVVTTTGFAFAVARGRVMRKRQASRLRVLQGTLPICAWCKNIRDGRGQWNRLEKYLRDHAEVEFTHGICPGCLERQRRS